MIAIRRLVAAILLGGTSVSALAQAPAPYEATPELVEAAKKEGKVVWYSASDVQLAEGLAKAFQAKYPDIKVQVERSGSERVFQRITQEYGRRIHTADVVETSDAVHFLVFKRQGWLLPAVPADVAKHWPKEARDADGQYAAYKAHLSVIGYNSKLVKAEDAPKSHKDLLDPKWRGRIVKAHPAYSGTILTGMDALLPLLGWEFYEQLGKQRVLQVQSSTEPPKKLAQGERPIMADGNEYNLLQLKDSGAPLEPVYASEGTPLVLSLGGILKNAPNPNAARLFYYWLYTKEAQQIVSEVSAARSFHREVKEWPGRPALTDIKVLYSDPVKLEPMIEDIKKKYEQYFGT
jgi:iron(III) transport system substrate-binding protein